MPGMIPHRNLVSAHLLLDHPEWRIFDCRHDLSDTGKGEREYAASHLPGAVHAHLDRDLSSLPNGLNGRHPLPNVERFIGWMGSCGLRSTDQVVAYDDSGGMYAARLWWLLRAAGHEQVAVLDGGLSAWCAVGGPLTTDVPIPEPRLYPARWDHSAYVDTSVVEANLRQQTLTFIDARGANRFAGQDETMDPVAGHIPGAINRPFLHNLQEGRFKSRDALASEFEALLREVSPAQVVHQCGSGVTACHNLLAMEIAGLRGSRLYPGSWSEWCSDPHRPVATGAA